MQKDYQALLKDKEDALARMTKLLIGPSTVEERGQCYQEIKTINAQLLNLHLSGLDRESE